MSDAFSVGRCFSLKPQPIFRPYPSREMHRFQKSCIRGGFPPWGWTPSRGLSTERLRMSYFSAHGYARAGVHLPSEEAEGARRCTHDRG